MSFSVYADKLASIQADRIDFRNSYCIQWDHKNRLTEATISSTAWSHEYNGDGVRMNRSDGTTTVDYVWDVVGGLPMLLQDGTHTYVYGMGLISIYDGSDMTYRLLDGLGSTVGLADEDGALVGEYTYDAYGNERLQSGATTEFSFAGEQSDPNGLDYLRARYYDPEIGRFLGRDPAGEGSNFYSYALNNPVNAVDPSGLAAAGVCINNSGPGGILVGCTEADIQALKNDKWYQNYLKGIGQLPRPPVPKCEEFLLCKVAMEGPETVIKTVGNTAVATADLMFEGASTAASEGTQFAKTVTADALQIGLHTMGCVAGEMAFCEVLDDDYRQLAEDTAEVAGVLKSLAAGMDCAKQVEPSGWKLVDNATRSAAFLVCFLNDYVS